MKGSLLLIVIISASLMAFLTYTAIDRGATTGNIIEELSRDTSNITESESENVVKIINFAYSPKEIEISKGDTVVWENRDNSIHTVTSDEGLFNSGDMARGDLFEYTFEEDGVYSYYCEPHPYMTGRVVVNGR